MKQFYVALLLILLVIKFVLDLTVDYMEIAKKFVSRLANVLSDVVGSPVAKEHD